MVFVAYSLRLLTAVLAFRVLLHKASRIVDAQVATFAGMQPQLFAVSQTCSFWSFVLRPVITLVVLAVQDHQHSQQPRELAGP